MTNEETLEALEILRAYDSVNEELKEALDALTSIQKTKDDLMERLERLKAQELDFMSRYREKYGDRNLLEDLHLQVQ